MNARNPDRCPTHPGEPRLEDILPAVRKPKTMIAEGLGISRQHLYDILAERKPVTAEAAVRLAQMFGGSTESWIRMQGAYDAWRAERAVDLSRIPTLVAAE